MFVYGFWFYHELHDKIGTRPAKHRGDPSDSFLTLETPHDSYQVKTSSYRLELFQQNPKCVSCDRLGTLWILESDKRNIPPHLNLYHVEKTPILAWKNLSKDGLVLMTKDHKIPKSKGGLTNMANLQTMCSICNGKKGAQINWLDSPERQFLLADQGRKNDPGYKGEMMCLNGILHLR